MSAQIIPLPEPTDRYGEPVRVVLPSIRPVARIQAAVALAYYVSPEHMVSCCRWRRVAWPRQVAMYLARELTDHSFPAIGRFFGGRNHSTVISSIKVVERRMAADPLARADVEALREALA